jgi:hypothetical protein
MHAANETLSIHPREFILFFLLGVEGGVCARMGFKFFSLDIMFPGLERVFQDVPKFPLCCPRVFPKAPKRWGKRKRDKACFYFGEGSILSSYVRECPMFQKY